MALNSWIPSSTTSIYSFDLAAGPAAEPLSGRIGMPQAISASCLQKLE